MKTFEKQARQGDVIITRINNIPVGGKAIKRESGKVVLAHGEVTGHMHAISERHVQHFRVDDVKALKLGERLRAGGSLSETYLLVTDKPCELTHEEHESIQIQPGAYIVRKQREHVRGQIRNVAD